MVSAEPPALLPDFSMLGDPITVKHIDIGALLRDAVYGEDGQPECMSTIPNASADSLCDYGQSLRLRPSSSKEECPAKKPKMASHFDAKPPGCSSDKPRQHKRRDRSRNEGVMRRGYEPSLKLIQKHLKRAQPIKTELNTAKLPAANGAYTARIKPVPKDPKENPEVKRLIESEGFQYISIDPASRVPLPIIDANGIVIAHIAPPPSRASYMREIDELLDVIVDESDWNGFSKDEVNHKRGNFPATNFGFTLPNGFKNPINLDESRHQEKIDRIRNCTGFTSVSNFQNSVFAFWNPEVYRYQKSHVEQVLANNPTLKRTSKKTIFPTTACNFCNTCCYMHRDTQNCPFGWCSITALGRFDHTKGGHLILWELKLVVEFPHGWTAMIPSATITHSNTPVAGHEIRVSITQYCSGALLRYADNMFHTDKELRDKDNALYRYNMTLKESRWQMSLRLLSTLEEIRTCCRHLPVDPMFQ